MEDWCFENEPLSYKRGGREYGVVGMAGFSDGRGDGGREAVSSSEAGRLSLR